MAKFTKRLNRYDIFDSYKHVLHFSQKTLKDMLEQHGFKVVRAGIGQPIQVPVWHKYVGYYYQYPCPWVLDPIRQTFRIIFYYLSLFEFRLRLNRIGYLAPNIIAVAKKN